MATIHLDDTFFDHLAIVIADDRLNARWAVQEAPGAAERKIAERWCRALENGYDWLVQQYTVEYDIDTWELTVESGSQPGTWYHANGECGCLAGLNGNPCYHRSAARLIRRCLERQERCEERNRADREQRFSAEYIEVCRDEHEDDHLASISPAAWTLPTVSRRAAVTSGIDELFA